MKFKKEKCHDCRQEIEDIQMCSLYAKGEAKPNLEKTVFCEKVRDYINRR